MNGEFLRRVEGAGAAFLAVEITWSRSGAWKAPPLRSV